MLIDPILTDHSILVDVGVERWPSLTLMGNLWTNNGCFSYRSRYFEYAVAGAISGAIGLP